MPSKKRSPCVVAITGGIASGKSTVTRLMGECGAHTVSADELAREVVTPGSAGLAALVQRCGQQILLGDGSLDRATLAQQMFADPQLRHDVEAITHPLIRQRFAQIRQETPDSVILCYEIPLLAETLANHTGSRDDFDVVVVVEVARERQQQRLRAKGWSDAQINERIAAQLSRHDRRAIADVVIDNSGDLSQLQRQVADLWQTLAKRVAS